MATLTPDAASAAGPAASTPPQKATPGVSPTDGTSIDAAPEGVPEHTQLALAKLNLMEAARAIKPLQPLRDHPWITVGTAAGAGVVAGSLGGGGGGHGTGGGLAALVTSLATLVRSLSGVLGPLSSIIGPFVAGKVAASATKDDAAESSANDYGTGDPVATAGDV